VTADEATADVTVMVTPSLVRENVGAVGGAEGGKVKFVSASDPEADAVPNGLPPLSVADADDEIVLDPSAECVTVVDPEPSVAVLLERKS
jgi:hypothetical protein